MRCRNSLRPKNADFSAFSGSRRPGRELAAKNVYVAIQTRFAMIEISTIRYFITPTKIVLRSTRAGSRCIRCYRAKYFP
jgi:hypothetical protein